jgi:CRP-like cAMP-binding protein
MIMSKINPIKLENNLISEIKKFSTQKKFSSTAPLFYEGQIPIVAYLILEGCVQLMKNKKIKKILKPGSLIGLAEMMTNAPSKLTAQVQAETTLCFLDKSTIKEIIHNEKDSDLTRLIIEEVT